MSAQEYYNSAPSSDGNTPQPEYYNQKQYSGNSPQQGFTSQQQVGQVPPLQGYHGSMQPANPNGHFQYHRQRESDGAPFAQQKLPLNAAPRSDELNGERGLGATVVGGSIGAFVAKKSGGGVLGAIGGAAAGAIGANMIEHVYKRHERREHRHDRRH
ncbi:hypothetical protein V8C35DRAFT_304850 [Trichoderma chlorosporum]